MLVRMASAFSGAPRACSSITRSSIDRGNVTPAALIACRSMGASSHGLPASRVSGGVLARISSSAPMRGPLPLRTSARRFRRLGEVAHGGGELGDVVDAVGADRGDRGALDVGQPDASHERAGCAVLRQRRCRASCTPQWLRIFPPCRPGDRRGRLSTRLPGCHPGIRDSEYPGPSAATCTRPARAGSRLSAPMRSGRDDKGRKFPGGSHGRSHREVRQRLDRHSQPTRGAQCRGRGERGCAGGGVRGIRRGQKRRRRRVLGRGRGLLRGLGPQIGVEPRPGQSGRQHRLPQGRRQGAARAAGAVAAGAVESR